MEILVAIIAFALVMGCSGSVMGMIETPAAEPRPEKTPSEQAEKTTITFRVVEPLLADRNGPGIAAVKVIPQSGQEEVKETATDGSVTFVGSLPLTVRIEKPGYITTTATVTDESGQEIVFPNEWPEEAKEAIRQLGLEDMIASGGLILRWGDTEFLYTLDGDVGGLYVCPNIIIRDHTNNGNRRMWILVHELMHVWQGLKSTNPPCEIDPGWTQSEEGRAWLAAIDKDLREVGPVSGFDDSVWASKNVPHENQASFYAQWAYGLERTKEELERLCSLAPNRCRYLQDRFGPPPPRMAETNSAPTADAGPDQTVTASDTVTLRGSGTDAEDQNLTYSWSQTGGVPTVELRTDQAATSFTAPDVDAVTMLTFALTVTDSGGLTGTDSVTVTVLPPLSVAVSVAFVEDSVRVVEGEEVAVGIRYRARELAPPLTIQVSVLEDQAEAADYELSETRFEIPAGRDILGTLELTLSARTDDSFAEGEEAIELRLLVPEAIGAEVGGPLSVTISDAAVSACVGVTLAGTPPEPVEEAGGLRIRTSLTSEWHASAREVTMRWVGPYGEVWHWVDVEHHPYYDERAKPFPPPPDFHIEGWQFDPGSASATHVMDVSWSAKADLELMFRCRTGAVVAVCDSAGCTIEATTASRTTSGRPSALHSALWGEGSESGLRAASYLVAPDRRWHPSVWGPGDTLVFHLSTENWPDDARMTPADVKEVLERMLAEWSAVPTADISWRVEGPVDGLLPGKDGKNIFWIDPGYVHGGGSGPTRWYETIDGVHGLVEADHRIDPNSLRVSSYDRPWPYIANELGMHPLGHTLGLEHAATFPVFSPCPGPRSDDCGRVDGDLGYWRDVRGAWQLDPIMSYGASGTLSFLDDGSALRLDDKIGASLLRPKPGWLETTGSIAGSVSTDDGRPVPFIHVWAVRPDERGLMDGTGSFANRNGDFLIRGLPPGDWILIAHPDLSWLANPWFFFERQGELTDEMMLFPVRARAGQTTSGIEITMSRGRMTTVGASR